jgi:carotenoid cleavage dioxygenase-like enzyme
MKAGAPDAAVPGAARDHAPWLERAFHHTPSEADYRIDAASGEVPGYLRGSYYVNGPAGRGRGGIRYRHWLDGDGMVAALHFSNRGVRFVCRFVRGTKYTEEEASAKSLYRAFGTRFEGDRLKRGIGLESPVNVSVWRWRDTLLAFGEQGLPWELDPATLETRGEYTFGGRLNAISPLSAHPNFDYRTGEMFNFGISFSARHPSLTLYRFAADGELALRKRLPIEHPCSVHDFGLGPRHAVFYLSPYLLDVAGLMRGSKTLMETLSWRPELGSRLLLASRESGELVASIPVGSGYCLHLANCFEADGLLSIDVIELERPVYDQYDVPDLFTEVRRACPKRFVVDPGKGELVDTMALDYRNMCDFPAIDPRRAGRETRDVWVLGISATEQPGRKFFDQVVRLDWRSGEADVYQAPAHHYFGGEPIFLGDPDDERRGTVICQRFDAERETMDFLLFDAFDVARGPTAVLPLRQPIHLGFHASYHPGY